MQNDSNGFRNDMEKAYLAWFNKNYQNSSSNSEQFKDATRKAFFEGACTIIIMTSKKQQDAKND